MDLSWLEAITLANLRAICRRHSDLTVRSMMTREQMHNSVAGLPEAVRNQIRFDVEQQVSEGRIKYRRSLDDSCRPRQRRRPNSHCTPNPSNDPIYAALEPSEQPTERSDFYEVSPACIETIIEGDFLRTPSPAILKERLIRYIDATNNSALLQKPCASCARLRYNIDLKEVTLEKVPHKHLLAPSQPHPAHILHHGMLIHQASLTDNGRQLLICGECFNALKNQHRPRFSLGNNMWIGDIPDELSDLTLPERMLIARYFPSAFIVKLFPKQKGAHAWDRSQMHRGLRGNVSTYRLDPRQVASMVDGVTYPPKALILSATIGITFVGPKGVREATMPNMFRVRRRKVREALLWLKAHNPLYADVVISEERLAELPNDGIPEELLRVAKYSSDTERLEREHAGYVPDDDEDGMSESLSPEMMREAGLEIIDEEDGMIFGHNDIEPAVIPLQSLGVIDIEGHDISASELFSHALSNTADAGTKFPEDFTIRRGSAFINEYARTDPVSGLRNDGGPSNANHLLGCFPCLFPYGQGGFEVARPEDVTYEAHARWAMEYVDKRFRKDYQFPFQVFGVMQKREVCRSAVLQMTKSAFSRNITLINQLTPEDLQKASQEESMGAAFSHPGIRALCDEMTGVRTKVKGTDESRHSVRSKVWGTNLLFNPPSLWVTINPADTQNPIAQVFAGADGIDLDAFCDTAGPDHVQRAQNMADDPFASAQFFHFTVRTVLEQLFGFKKLGGGKMEREYGIVGKVQAYIGTVEAQGRGTLHLHMLLWLKDAPTAGEMKAALSSPEFREKMKRYIASVIKADIDGKNKEEILAIPKVKGISYSRPFDPRTRTQDQSDQQLAKLVRALQYHKCTPAACLKVVRGRLVCKRRAPFQTAAEDWVDEAGHWGPKRLCDMLNAFNPTVMHAIASNHDFKLILDGKDTATITFYVTNYATKKQQRSSNVTALLAKSLAFTKENDRHEQDFNLANKRLIQRCANSLTRYREFSGPEVMTYIMNWGDVYESHHYVSIYWDNVLSTLRKIYPELSSGPRPENAMEVDSNASMPSSQTSAVTSGTQTENVNDCNANGNGNGYKELATVELIDGKPLLKDNLRDYRFRGDQLLRLNFLDFMLETYEGDAPKTDEDVGANMLDNVQPRGRPPNPRVLYKAGANKPKRCRIIRTRGHETLPRFVGKWFPRRNADSTLDHENYAASMLALLKPWTNLHTLKNPHSTFTEALEALLAEGNRKIHTVVHNIQYYYDCLDGAKARQEEEKDGNVDAVQPMAYGLDLSDQDINDAIDDAQQASATGRTWDGEEEITEEDIEIERMTKYEARELAFGEGAIVGGYDAGFFIEEAGDEIEWEGLSRKAASEEIPQIRAWEKLLKETTRQQIVTPVVPVRQETEDPSIMAGSLQAIQTAPRVQEMTSRHTQATAIGNLGARPRRDILNQEQRRAHDIVEETIQQELAGIKPPQLRMLILGQGGTGKSMLIGAISETIIFYGVLHWLAKCATTGIAASDIGGQTLHSWAGISRNTSKDDDWLEKTGSGTLAKRRRNIEGKKVLILDEISMAEKSHLYQASEIVGNTLAEDFKGSATEPFGGMHVILAGDFHQFPPVGNMSGALYVDDRDENHRAIIGREIFLQFETVVILREQIRVRDKEWSDILNRLRVGECDFKDIKEIEKLVLTNPECNVPNFQEKPWSEAILVTSRHAVREKWNEHALMKHCQNTGQLRYICPAEDIDRATKQPPGKLARFVVAGMQAKQTGKLVDTIAIAKGMKAMVLLNLATEADIANGTRGVIEDIILDPREDDVCVDNGVVSLKYPPVMLLLRPDKPTDLVFEGITPGLIPITPSQTIFTAKSEGGKKFRIQRRQYALTAGYAFTDYKSQGQTIEYVIIDIGKPPRGGLSAFGTYVALSRSRGRDTIRLLRDFDRHLFQHHPSEHLRKDMERLERLDMQTKERFEKGDR